MMVAALVSKDSPDLTQEQFLEPLVPHHLTVTSKPFYDSSLETVVLSAKPRGTIVVKVPLAELPLFLQTPESRLICAYILHDEPPIGSRVTVYVGKAANGVLQRYNESSNCGKPWCTSIIFIFDPGLSTHHDGHFLERRILERLKANRTAFIIKNIRKGETEKLALSDIGCQLDICATAYHLLCHIWPSAWEVPTVVDSLDHLKELGLEVPFAYRKPEVILTEDQLVLRFHMVSGTFEGAMEMHLKSRVFVLKKGSRLNPDDAQRTVSMATVMSQESFSYEKNCLIVTRDIQAKHYAVLAYLVHGKNPPVLPIGSGN